MTKIKFHLAAQPRSGLHWSDVKHEITEVVAQCRIAPGIAGPG